MLASPLGVVERLWSLTASGELPLALAGALQHMVLGYLIACAIAIPLGMLMGRNRFINDLADPIVNLVYAVPSVAWVPFIMIWCGLYLEARARARRHHVRVRHDHRGLHRRAQRRPPAAQRRPLLRRRRLAADPPGTAARKPSFLFTALRIGVVRAVNAMITAELFLAAVNLGAIMKLSRRAARQRGGARHPRRSVPSWPLALQEVLLVIERRICIWRPRTKAARLRSRATNLLGIALMLLLCAARRAKSRRCPAGDAGRGRERPRGHAAGAGLLGCPAGG